MAISGSNPPNQITNPAAAIPVYIASNGSVTSVVSGQQTATTSALALASHALSDSVTISAPSTNTAVVYVGPAGVTSSNGFALAAGQSINLTIPNTNLLYIIAPTGSPVVTYLGA